MLTAEFCRQMSLTRDAVRLYVKLELIMPTVDAHGCNCYQQFGSSDVERAALIRAKQQLGFTLKQIVALNREYAGGGMDAAEVPR